MYAGNTAQVEVSLSIPTTSDAHDVHDGFNSHSPDSLIHFSLGDIGVASAEIPKQSDVCMQSTLTGAIHFNSDIPTLR